MKKRILSILLVVFLTVSFSLPSFAATAMKITGATSPTVLKQGDPFVAEGVITSDCDILKVVIGVYNSSGKAEFEYTGLPGETRYDISNVDYLLTFSKLPTGTFTYKIVATDEKSSNVVLLNKSFTVNTTGKTSTLKITNANYPTTLAQGEGYSVKGTVSSDYNITKVVFGAYNSNGTKGFEYTATPNAKSFDISSVDYSLTFSKLAAGTYTYKITASDTAVSNVVLLEKSFTVTGAASSSTLKLTNANYPTEVFYGEGFSVTGVVTSSYNISKVVIGAYNINGTVGFEYTATPGTTRYDISSVDYLLTFSKLSVGTYTYKITATDSKSSNVVLLNKSFNVTSKSSSSINLKKVNWDVVDISYWNTINSWSRMAANFDAVILRIGFTYTSSKKMVEDSSFSSFYSNAKSNGIPVGCYYFSAATTVSEAEAEADFVISLLKKYNCQMEMPIYYDLETEEQVDLSQSACTEIAKAFCNKLSQAGWYVGIYCNKYFARDELYASELSDRPFWIAEYNSSCTYNGEYGMWQYSESGDPPGIDYPCDMNICYYDYPSYIKGNGLNGFKPVAVGNPKFELITGKNLSYSEKDKEIYLRNDPGLTKEQFIAKYVKVQDMNIIMAVLTSDGKVATGTVLQAKTTGIGYGPYGICLIGDINCDSKINSSDALAILNHSVGAAPLEGYRLTSADWNGDSKVNSADALAVLNFSVSR